MNEQKIKSDLLESFDFQKAHEVMKLLDWRWAEIDSVPSPEQIKVAAEVLINDLLKDEYLVSVSSGGLLVKKSCELTDGEYDSFELSFIALKAHCFLGE